MKDSKNLVIGMLCAVVCIMAVAYALFQTQLDVSGTTTIASNWQVEIQSIECDSETTAHSSAATTASFKMSLSDKLKSDTCTVTIINNGNLPAVVAPQGLLITGEGVTTDNIQFEVDDAEIQTGAELGVGQTHTYTITGTYIMDLDNDNVPDFLEENYSKDVTVTVVYEQDLS